MISFNALGSNGRLGNQLFQYAALKGIAAKRGYYYCIPPSNNSDHFKEHQLIHYFNVNTLVGYTGYFTLQEADSGFDSKLFNNCPDNVDLNGYFQSEKYFKHIEGQIREEFTFKYESIYPYPEGDYIAVHVRRGDYLLPWNVINYPECNADYYSKAMYEISAKSNAKFVIVSDDIEWCKNQQIFKDCYFHEGVDHINDLYVMSKAKHNIIANSSFGWWGAWLNSNPDKIVICPKNWYGQTFPENHDKDLIPESWIRM